MSAIRMILSGCSGFMGHVITELAAADPDIEIAAGIDPAGSAGLAYPVFADAAGNFVLRNAAHVHEFAVCECFFERVQVFALDVFYECDFKLFFF